MSDSDVNPVMSGVEHAITNSVLGASKNIVKVEDITLNIPSVSSELVIENRFLCDLFKQYPFLGPMDLSNPDFPYDKVLKFLEILFSQPWG